LSSDKALKRMRKVRMPRPFPRHPLRRRVNELGRLALHRKNCPYYIGFSSFPATLCHHLIVNDEIAQGE